MRNPVGATLAVVLYRGCNVMISGVHIHTGRGIHTGRVFIRAGVNPAPTARFILCKIYHRSISPDC